MRLVGLKRFQFAREHKDWTLEQWKKVMWSDESRFTLFQSDGRIRVRREADEVMHPSCLVPSVNLVTLQKLIETVPQQMRAVIKAKGSPMKFCVTFSFGSDFFFWPGSVYIIYIASDPPWAPRLTPPSGPLLAPRLTPSTGSRQCSPGRGPVSSGSQPTPPPASKRS